MIQKKIIQYLLWTAAILSLAYATVIHLPPNSGKSVGIFATGFIGFSLFLGISCFGLGNLLRDKIFGSDWGKADIALGLGIFSVALNIYVKFTIAPAPFAALLGISFLYGCYVFYYNWKDVQPSLTSWDVPVIGLALGLILLNLSVGSFAGLLYFPTDFDSSLFHVTFPKAVIQKGHYFNPYWLRVPWHPQLTHNWYIFILGLLGDVFLKCLNLVCLAQLAILFVSSSDKVIRLFGALVFSVLAASPEFQSNIATTSLDTMLVVFCAPAFAVLFHFFKTEKKFQALLLMTVLCSFAAGQKHFGFIFSAPMLSLPCLFYVLVYAKSYAERVRRCFQEAGLVLLFLGISLSFYIHNLMEGTALLFPFFGTENTYGWTPADLRQMLEDTIPHWGHSKSLFGFFLIPVHLMQFPAEYQFAQTGSIYDWALSLGFWSVAAIFVSSLILPRLRKPIILIPAIVIFAQLFGWYKGSQVIRYLYPLLIANAYFLFIVFAPAVKKLPTTFSLAILPVLLLAQSFAELRTPLFPLPTTRKEREMWLKTYATPNVTVYQWLRGHVEKGEQIIHIGESGIAHNFPQLVLCGDWFAKCNYSKFLKKYISFRDWTEIVPLVKENNFRYIVVYWDFVNKSAPRPNPAGTWDGAFPESTAACLEHVYHDGSKIDVFRIKDSCR